MPTIKYIYLLFLDLFIYLLVKSNNIPVDTKKEAVSKENKIGVDNQKQYNEHEKKGKDINNEEGNKL